MLMSQTYLHTLILCFACLGQVLAMLWDWQAWQPRRHHLLQEACSEDLINQYACLLAM